MSNKPPIEVPQGAIRLNTDSQKLEFFAQDRWYEMATNTPNLDGGARGIIAGGGNYPAETNRIQFLTIPTQGNTTDFGDLTQAREGIGGMSNTTRAAFSQGGNYGAPVYNIIDFITIPSTGNATDFGDALDSAREVSSAGSNHTRGLTAGGLVDDSANTDRIGAITFSTTGNALDFGNLTAVQREAFNGILSTGIRGFNCGGLVAPTFSDTINMITIPTFGDAVDFGDLIKDGRSGGAVGNSTRGFTMGYAAPSDTFTTEIQKFNLISGGNAVETGECVVTRQQVGVSDPTRGVTVGGYDGSNGSTNMEYINFSTEGNSVDFGDLTEGTELAGGASNAHGGL